LKNAIAGYRIGNLNLKPQRVIVKILKYSGTQKRRNHCDIRIESPHLGLFSQDIDVINFLLLNYMFVLSLTKRTITLERNRKSFLSETDLYYIGLPISDFLNMKWLFHRKKSFYREKKSIALYSSVHTLCGV